MIEAGLRLEAFPGIIADHILRSDWLAAHDAQVRAEERERWENWLFTTNWPFDWNSDVPPPTTAEAMGRIWNERDGWGIADEDAANAVAAESGIARAEPTDSEES